MIPFNKPYLTGKETHYIYEALNSGKLSGNGIFIKRCQDFFEQRFCKQLINRTKQAAFEFGLKIIEVHSTIICKPAAFTKLAGLG